jgi:hypothetical protein
MARNRKPTWFKVNIANKGALESIDDANVGKALKAALRYFESEGQDTAAETEIKDPTAKIAFGIFKQGADESIKDYQARVEDGKKGAAAKKEQQDAMAAKVAEFEEKYKDL